jgi:hypothetical protein
MLFEWRIIAPDILENIFNNIYKHPHHLNSMDIDQQTPVPLELGVDNHSLLANILGGASMFLVFVGGIGILLALVSLFMGIHNMTKSRSRRLNMMAITMSLITIGIFTYLVIAILRKGYTVF